MIEKTCEEYVLNKLKDVEEKLEDCRQERDDYETLYRNALDSYVAIIDATIKNGVCLNSTLIIDLTKEDAANAFRFMKDLEEA